MDEFLIQFLPRFDYHLIDMANYSNNEIKEIFKDKQLQVSLLLMKNIFYETELLELLKDIFANPINLSDKRYEKQFYEIITSYIYNLSTINIQKFIEIMETMTSQHSKTFISTARQLEKKGEIIGEITGIEKEKKRIAYNLILKGSDNQFIMETTGLSNLQIKYLRTLDKYQIKDILN